MSTTAIIVGNNKEAERIKHRLFEREIDYREQKFVRIYFVGQSIHGMRFGLIQLTYHARMHHSLRDDQFREWLLHLKSRLDPQGVFMDMTEIL